MAVLNNKVADDSNIKGDEPSKSNLDKDGCLILGGLGKPNNVTYTTKYRINHKLERKGTCLEAVEKTIMPCCDKNNITSCVDFATAFLKSEGFILILHLGALALGATKEALDMRLTNPKLHFVQSLFEKVVCVATILLRVFATYINFKEGNEMVTKLEYVESKRTAYSKSLRCTSVLFTLIAILIIFLVVTGFVLLHLYAHLGWTIITTNSSLMIIQILYIVICHRQDIMIQRITLDHHKLALEESILLVKEGLCYRGWVNKEYITRCREFIVALDNTAQFVRPYYIEINEGEDLTMCETVSSV